MAQATEAQCLVLLRRQLDQRYPKRSRALDGILRNPSVGPPSDHHKGNAIDVTHDPSGGLDAGKLALELVRQMAANPVGGRLSYVIWDRRIASGAHGWRWRPYGRSCPHVKHVHLSIKATHRNVLRPWSLERL